MVNTTTAASRADSFWLQGAVFTLLNSVDAVSTKALLDAGLASEGNWLRLFDSTELILVKILLTLAVLVFIYCVTKRPSWVMRWVNTGLGLVVLWNLAWLVIASWLGLI